MSGRRGVSPAPIDPARFARALIAGLAAGEAAGEESISSQGRAPDGSVTVTTLPDSPHTRAAFALKRHFAGDDAAFESAWPRFRALMDLFSRGLLGVWARAGEGGRSALHPAVIDVASHMRLSDNGRFAPRKFLAAVAATARERYPELEGWDG